MSQRRKEILEFLKKQDWPVTTEEVAKKLKISWQTVQIHLLRLLAEDKVKFKKVGKQNQWMIR